MKIVVIGTGGVGGYYGGLLAQHGEDVTFVVRGTHLEAIRQRGLQIKSVHGDFTVTPAKATGDLSEIGVIDLVLFCVKTYDTERVAQQIISIVGPDTLLVSLQNGVDAAERIGNVVGMRHMLAGATWISSAVESPGVIKQVSQFRRIVVGELDGSITERVQAVYQAFQKTGITTELSENIAKILWTKFIFISAASSLGSLTRLSLGEYRHIPETRRLITGLMREVEAVAHALEVALDPDVVEKSLEFIDQAAPFIKASMQNDVETGHCSELESLIGVIGRKGHLAGVNTPIADMMYAALLPVEHKALMQANR